MPHRRSTRIIHRLFGGRRGAVLILLGFIFCLTGYGYLAQPLTPGAARQLHVALYIAPQEVWGVVFIVVGGLSLVNSRWPQGQRLGYGLLTAMSVFWSFMYLSGVTRDAQGAYRGVLAWAAIACLVLIISGWSEVPYRPDEEPHS